MANQADLHDISFFELDRLFTASARALRRKLRRRRAREKRNGEDVSPSRSRTPSRRHFGRETRLAQVGGFTGAVEKVERAIVVGNVPAGADERMIFHHFSKWGPVIDVKIVYNRFDHPTGVVIVELGEDEAVDKIVNLESPDDEIMGSAVKVKRADAQIIKSTGNVKRTLTRQQFTQQVLTGLKAGADTGAPTMRKLHIKNLRAVVTEDDMKGIFKPFGEFDKFEMGTQECWITYVNHGEAQDAMQSMQGFQLVGQELMIAMMPAVTQMLAPALPITAPHAPNAATERMIDIIHDSDFGATGAGANPLSNRIELMKKLMAQHSEQGVPTVVGLNAPSAGSAAPTASQAQLSALPPAPKPGVSNSRTLLLQNMFTPGKVDLKKDPRFYEDIREDTHDECAKFGKVQHVTVDPRGTTGLIYVLYESSGQRLDAEMALNGRWFEGKKIVAAGIDDSIWTDLAAQATNPPPAGAA